MTFTVRQIRKERLEVLVIVHKRAGSILITVRIESTFAIPEGQLDEDDPHLHIWGESISGARGGIGRDRALPTRVLRDFTVFDANNRNTITSLQDFTQTRPPEGDVSLRASGIPSTHATDIDGEEELDDRQDDDVEDGKAPPITLTEILACKVEYGSSQGM